MTRGKRAIPLDLPQPLALGAPQAQKQKVVYEELRGAILDGLLKAGEYLPATRTLAERWQVSRGIVEIAFDRLSLEGYIERKIGSGSIVSAVVPDTLLRPEETPPSTDEVTGSCDVWADTSSEHYLCADEPFLARVPDPSLLDMSAWRSCLSNAFARLTSAELVTGRTLGRDALRERVSEYLRAYRGIPCSADDVIITTGIRSATEMIAKVVLRAGDAAAVEDPGYVWARRLLADAGATLKYIEVDEEGIQVHMLEKTHRVKLVYVTPAHQAPLGVTMSARRRLELLDWAEKTDAFIVEDDYDSEFNYNASPLPAIKAIDKVDRVIYCGSLNKTLFADLRMGYCIVPRRLRQKWESEWEFSGRGAGVIEQAAVEQFMEQGHFAKHLRIARQAYHRRRDLLLRHLTKVSQATPSVTGHHAGFHFVLWLPEGLTEDTFCRRAAELGIALQPLSLFCYKALLSPAVLIGYTALSEQKIERAGRQLCQLLIEFASNTRY